MYRLTISGGPSSPGTAFALGAAAGTAIAYVGAKTIPHLPPRPEPGYHAAEAHPGPAEAIMVVAVLGVAGVEAFRYLRDL